MALGIVSSGTAAFGTIGLDTPTDLVSTTTSGVYIATFNAVNLVKGDTLRVYFTVKVLTGDTEATYQEYWIDNDQEANHIWQIGPVRSGFSLSLMAEQTDGTGRDVPWELCRIAEY